MPDVLESSDASSNRADEKGQASTNETKKRNVKIGGKAGEARIPTRVADEIIFFTVVPGFSPEFPVIVNGADRGETRKLNIVDAAPPNRGIEAGRSVDVR